jgi:spermidine synthase
MNRAKFEVLACEDTKLGLLILRRRELLSRPGTIVTEITLNHEFLMSSYITLSERSLAQHALALHPGRDLNVLVGGLGLGYTAHEVLVGGGERIARVEVVEFLPEVIEWVGRDLVPLSGELRGDERLVLVEADVYDRLSRPPEQKYDLILIDVDHSPDEHLGDANADFYTEAGLRRARKHLADSGILAVWSYAEHSPFATALRSVFSDVRVEPITVVNDLVDEEQAPFVAPREPSPR